ncbi:MAG: methyltransferase domain-containing protein [Acidipila sp.]|nr:methyltransferase domain-containing protein [Acidipila sp.]
MSQSSASQVPSLELIFESIHGFQRTGAIKAALELDVFTGMAEEAKTAAALAARSHASERGMRILCDYLALIGLLTKTGDRYALTPDSGVFLSKKSPGYMGTAVEFLLSPPQVDPFQDVASAVRSGRGVAGQGVVAPEHPIWVNFARAMAPLMTFPAELLAGLLTTDTGAKVKVLDIAAGHGLYGIAVAKRNPNAEITAVDWPNVLEVALENARAAEISNRFHTIAGSAFDVDFGNGYDLVLLVNFLHHFAPATVENVLRKVWKALAKGGRTAILEFIPNEDRVSPRVPAAFSMMMLVTTPGGNAYTFAEYERMLRAAGFASSELHDLAPTYFRAVLARK